jgi:hypothetical protein
MHHIYFGVHIKENCMGRKHSMERGKVGGKFVLKYVDLRGGLFNGTGVRSDIAVDRDQLPVFVDKVMNSGFYRMTRIF